MILPGLMEALRQVKQESKRTGENSGLQKLSFRYSNVLHFLAYFKKHLTEKKLSNNGG
jgi:hypothetical protein